jgi:hypothetical protein
MSGGAAQRTLDRPLTQPKSLFRPVFPMLGGGGYQLQRQFDNQIALFARNERTGRYVFNSQALKALGIDPAEAQDRGYQLEDESGSAALSTA